MPAAAGTGPTRNASLTAFPGVPAGPRPPRLGAYPSGPQVGGLGHPQASVLADVNEGSVCAFAGDLSQARCHRDKKGEWEQALRIGEPPWAHGDRHNQGAAAQP